MPNGAIFTTVDDLARFVAFELGRGPDSVLARPILDEAFGGIVATDADLETGYGLGFMAMRRDGFSFLGHSGSVAGYQAAMYYDRGMQLGVVLFRNVIGGKQNPDRLAVDILSLLAWMRFEPNSPIHELIRTVSHVAFEVDDLDAALKGQTVIHPPGSPSDGVRSAMIVHNGAPVELTSFRWEEPLAPAGS